MAGDLLPVADALARLLALAEPLPVAATPLVDTVGRPLAADCLARRTQPAADLSAMDGYAIRFADLPSPWTVTGESAAGAHPAGTIGAGEAMRIFTGAPMPEGADTVIIQEEVARDGDHLVQTGEGPPRTGAHVRAAGGDFRAGDRLIAAGTRLTAAHIALAAVGGHGTLPIRRRARVAILSTGDELVPAGDPTPGVLLPSSNAPMLAALLAGWPVEVIDCGIVRDDRTALARALADAARDADILVTTGGASVGTRDLVRPALADAGATLDFWRIAMKPGKPLLAGRLADTVVLGLPGNPVSAFVTALLFLLPLVARMSDAADRLPKMAKVPLAGPLPATGGRAEYVRARLGEGWAVPLDAQDSAGLAALAQATLLIVRPAHAPPAQAGDSAEVLIFA